MLRSSSRDDSDPGDDGRDDRSRDLRPPSRGFGDLGDFGAVNGEKPDGGLAVRMVGGLAASSSRGVPSSSLSAVNDGDRKAP